MEKQTLPDSNLVLTFGIISVIGCCCIGILGVIFGIIAIVMANKATAVQNESPELYEGFNNVKTGKILGIIGVILGLISTVYTIWIFTTIGMDGYMKIIEEMSGQYQ